MCQNHFLKMGSMGNLWFLALVLLSTLSVLSATGKKTYIVHMNHNLKPLSHATHNHWYQSLTSTSDSILYTYTAAFPGFAAYLDPEEADSLKKMDSVLNVFESRLRSLHTTRSPEFLGIHSNFGLGDGRQFQEIEQAAHNVIIGFVDTGVWPESKSFDDTGLPDIPKRWKGKCLSAKDFNPKLCNKKLIGARYFLKGFEKEAPGEEPLSPRDYNGHGTHTASTAAGSPVANVSVGRYGSGTVRGMAVRARVAIYKACGNRGCTDADTLAAMDKAILDGVDVISMSFGNDTGVPYHEDTNAIGAFHAMQHGVFVSAAGGNSGYKRSLMGNMAPWMLTVGAGSIDRDFPAYILLGNKQLFRGISIYDGPRMGKKLVGLVYNKGNNSLSNYCMKGTVEPALVRGKVVICDAGGSTSVENGLRVRKAGGVGMIVVNPFALKELSVENDLVPTVAIGTKVGNLIKEYEKTNPNPKVILGFGGVQVNVKPSPMVAEFSCRGPNPVTPQILKPDIIAPGVNILAAWPEAVSPSRLKMDKRTVKFNYMTGTSMACPHASGIAALIKAAHPSWSISAIKSAMMTTAYNLDNTNFPIRDVATGKRANPWDFGSGHVNPAKAFSPGLIYDISKQDYAKFFCSLNYPLDQTKLNIDCSEKFADIGELNYPSFSVFFTGNRTMVQYSRELTNVGPANSIYGVTVDAPPSVAVAVNPRRLVFRRVGEKHKYTVTFTDKRDKKSNVQATFGWIMWSNNDYKVRSPVAFAWP